MTTTTSFKDIITLPQWRPLAVLPSPYLAGGSLVSDLRNNEDRHPLQYWMYATSVLGGYNIKNDGWEFVINPGLAGSQTNGGCGVFCPSQGPNGALAAGATTTSVVISTALPAAVGVNQLANRGDGRGYKIRIIGLSAGGSGTTEERYIVGNTAGTQPTIYLDAALTFTPAATDRYEFLSGRVYFLSTNSAGGWKYYDTACHVMSGNLSITNLPSVNNESSMIALDELHVPYNRAPGEGYFGNLIATASGATSITGQAAAGDAAVLQNEYRNFQIRIITDVTTPTAAGQRRNITSHTAGASPVYTVPAWTVQPSADATFVIENNTDRILLWTSGQQSTYTYLVAANTWDTTTFATRGQSIGVGVMSVHPFGITLDAGKNARYSHVLSFRGGNSTLDLFDIAGAATGSWAVSTPYSPTTPWAFYTTNITAGFSLAYCPATEQGRYAYLNYGGASQTLYRLDLKSRVFEPWAWIPYSGSGAGTAYGMRLASTIFIDGSTKISFVHMISAQLSTQVFWQCLITR